VRALDRARCRTPHSASAMRGRRGTVAPRTEGIGPQAGCVRLPSSPTVGVGQLSQGPHRHANAARLPVGTYRVKRGRAGGYPALDGATRPSQCRPRLPSGAHLQFWPRRRLPRMLVGLHLPRMPLHSCPLHRRRHATRVPADALHLGRLRPISPSSRAQTGSQSGRLLGAVKPLTATMGGIGSRTPILSARIARHIHRFARLDRR
jgi:hypothetical protein